MATAVELRILLGLLKRRLREERKPGDWTPSQRSVLSRLERDGPATVTSLARAEGMRPQSMGSIVAVLEEEGWLAGMADPSDGRRTILSLTEACREKARETRAAREDWLYRTMLAKLSAKEQDELAGAADLLKKLLE